MSTILKMILNLVCAYTPTFRRSASSLDSAVERSVGEERCCHSSVGKKWLWCILDLFYRLSVSMQELCRSCAAFHVMIHSHVEFVLTEDWDNAITGDGRERGARRSHLIPTQICIVQGRGAF